MSEDVAEHNDVLALASNQLLAPGDLDPTDIERLLGTLMTGHIDNADAFFQHSTLESWVLEDGAVKDATFTEEHGVGVRAMSGEKTGFAYSDDIARPALARAADAARAIVRAGSDGQVPVLTGRQASPLYPAVNPLVSWPDQNKIDLLRELDTFLRERDPRVREVVLSLVAHRDVCLIAASDGTLAADVRPLVRLNASVIVEEHGRREQGYAGGGSRSSLDYFADTTNAKDYASEALRQALVQLEAKPAPAGTMPVVLGPGWPGVLLHEAVGHGLEGDFNRKGTSAFSGRVGEQVASSLCTVVDDGTIPGRRGSLTVDDEGTPTERTVLIENGILRGYMQDKRNARLSGAQTTGNGRRESYAHLPMPRMTNTYMLAGPHDPAEIIESVDEGIYAPNFGGGQVDITSGKFVFSASEAYLIEGGKITTPVKGATLIGNGPDVMTRISMVGNDMKLDSGVGVCGKDGQSVPVGVGQPSLKIDELTVGGTAS
ncbi:MAG: metalloprotease TldD [Pseudomonadota bacterium]